ncbi:HYR domain-containing protein [Mariniphaga sediminis]|uniref:HYR domain-containing protein n=1 Tax=Mariniphaga sediminis TaxID=1628158 RepID=A0A399D4F6_9BACT|nr:HYR domain-containing protein [Mariniphaga sediminis]RIH66068.1 HYR domain-containing protein [Mariniphaga sediminis]
MRKIYLLFLTIMSTSVFCYGQISHRTIEDNAGIGLKSQEINTDVPVQLSAVAGEVVYLKTNTCDYWSVDGNVMALDATFGSGNWTAMEFETVDVGALLASEVRFIFMDGSDCGTCEFITFLNAYRTDFEDWVTNGGSLFLNAARNECSGTFEMMAGISLNDGSSGVGYPADNTHPVFVGPKTPVLANPYYGSSWSHDYLSGPDLYVIMTGLHTNPILAEKDLGAGKIMFGGLTLDFIGDHEYWTPEPEVSNLYSNILQYMYDASISRCPDIVTNNDPGTSGAVVTYDAPAAEGAIVTQIDDSGLTSGDIFPVGETVQEYEFDFGPEGKDTCSFTVTVEDNEAPVAVCKESGIGNAAYIISTSGAPWGQNTNEQAMDMVFGSGNWDQLYYETLDPGTLLSNAYDFIFMEGGDDNANEMETFVDANISALETWVANGGHLFLNAAPNEGDGMNWGFWGVELNYPSSSGSAEAAAPEHPIFAGPFTPVITGPYSGSSYSHASIPEELNVVVLIQEVGNPNKQILSYAEWGSGLVFFGGMTTTNFHSPQPEATNLRANMIDFLSRTQLDFQLDKNKSVTITPADIDGGSSDNVDIASMEVSPSQFGIDDVGEQLVTLTVTDNAGNSSSCTSTIIIKADYVTAPQVVANSLEVYLDETGKYVLNHEDLEVMAEGTTDNLTPFEELDLSAYPKIFECDNIGEVIHTRLTVEDADGNISRAWTTVTVLDTLPPAALCQDIEVYLDENGEASITPEDVAVSGEDGSYDACGIVSLELDKQTFGCADAGPNNVTITVTDPSGNTGTCTAVVTVKDTFPPVFEPVADIQLEVEPGVTETAINYPGIVVTDNCTLEPQLSEGLGPDGLFPLGTTTETWVASDPAGNMATVSFTVTVAVINSPPVLVNPIADQAVNASYVLKVPVRPELGEVFDDVDGDELTISAMLENGDPLPAWAEMVNDSLVFTPLIADTGCVSIIVKATDPDGAAAADTFQLCVDGYPVSSPAVDAAALNVTLYPNPTRDRVNIEVQNSISGPAEISVFTMDGKRILQRNYTDNRRISFSMKEHVSGMYFVKINLQGKDIVKKLILNK